MMAAAAAAALICADMRGKLIETGFRDLDALAKRTTDFANH